MYSNFTTTTRNYNNMMIIDILISDKLNLVFQLYMYSKKKKKEIIMMMMIIISPFISIYFH